MNSGSTTVAENYNNATASIQGTTKTTTTTSTETPATTLHASPPQGIGNSFIAASTTRNANLTMTADSGASSHFIDNRILPGIEQRMLNHVHLEPPEIINGAGGHRLSGVKGILIVEVEDQQGIKHPISFQSRSYQGSVVVHFQEEQQQQKECLWFLLHNHI